MKLKAYLVAAALTLSGGAAMAATPIPYANPGTVNPAAYTFTATADGELMGYFAGSGASDTESVGVLINGVASPNGLGLPDHGTSVGTAFDFGTVKAGDTLVFYDVDTSSNNTWYSLAGLNSDKVQHVYSTSATAGQLFSGSPVGTYLAFEDLPNGGDLNYFDDTFVFTNTSVTGGLPEPGSWALLLTGVAAMGMALRARRRTSVAAA